MIEKQQQNLLPQKSSQKIIAAMNFKSGMNIIVQTSYHTCYKLIAFKNRSPFYAPLWRLTARDRRLAQDSNVGVVK